MIYISTEVKL